MRALVPRQRGLSIVELMVSVAISVAVLSALTYVYVGSRGAYRTNEALARVQETGRFALEWISRDIRRAGYMGCLSRGAPVTVFSYDKSKTPPGPAVLGVGSSLYGYESTTTQTGSAYVFPNPTTISRTGMLGDAIAFTTLDGAIAYVDDDRQSDPANTKARVSACPANNQAVFRQNDVLVVTNCQQAGIFTVSNNPGCNNTDGSFTITHANDLNSWPNNVTCPYTGVSCSADFKFDPPYNKSDRAFFAKFAQIGYFIGRNVAGRPALYRYRSTGEPAEAVVDNIEDLDFLFGVDTDNNGAIDTYMKADAVTAAGQWDRVLSVRVSLVAVSGELSVRANLAQTKGDRAAILSSQVVYLRDENGDTVVDAQAAGTDRQLRQVFTTTVALRNRLP